MSENDASDALPFEFNAQGQMVVRIKMSRVRYSDVKHAPLVIRRLLTFHACAFVTSCRYGAKALKGSRSRFTAGDTGRRGKVSSNAGPRPRVRARAAPPSTMETTGNGGEGDGERHSGILQNKTAFTDQGSDADQHGDSEVQGMLD